MLGNEIDLLRNYPKSKRDTKGRAKVITEADREIARQYGKDFFDGDRTYGYGGFSYMPRFWQPVVPDLQAHFGLTNDSSLLDVGCAKGFMLYDLQQHIPGITLRGVDISQYALENAKEEVKDLLSQGDAKALPFEDNSFDVVMSINTIHNLDEHECAMALREIERVSRGKSFITVDAYRNDEEKERMLEWALTAKTIMHVNDWKQFFADNGYTGDFYWFIP
ncbi:MULTISPECIES: class I SAM-dependent methyltransferase [Pseudoalteromonas]|uniref:Methyltransferase type 11 n=1 Tax=Pseudoalteromonas amylolytica TaxID=1859457 RepID=A0A1S1MVQ4_9GAMM|nr:MULTISPECIES: class I SAM-dependent methyltransferase [Pseudoalteromonas]MCF6434693.1 class I SAM-dependent methyltransferase [Pseudoalteromonas sp. MMG022]OHU87566.1 methyltransferase type 11 [Pseudoalteromonas sp. JW3]OHU91009.1 methyltransferase type 11 [Pseudoalteromonas amylolytica]